MPRKKGVMDMDAGLNRIAKAEINTAPIDEERSYFIGKGAKGKENYVDPFDIRKKCIADYVAYRKSKIYEKDNLLENIISEDLQGLLNPGKRDAGREGMELVLRKYRPEIYKKTTKDCLYKVGISRNPEEFERAAKVSDSCISDCGPDYFEEAMADSGAIFLMARKNNRLKGYSRLFLMRNRKKEVFLAIDIFRLADYKSGNSTDLVHAIVLATIQLGFDIGADYVIENNSIDGSNHYIKSKPKKGFSDLSMDIKLTKIGGMPITYYAFKKRHEGTVNVLMQNWKK